MVIVLLLGILFFIFFYLVGSFFLQHRVKWENGFTQHLVNFWVGLVLSVSLFAIIKTGFLTILLLLPLVLLAFRQTLGQFSEARAVASWRFLLGAAGIYVLLFFLQVNFSLGVFQNPRAYLDFIHPLEGERYMYSTILSLLHYNGVETISTETALQGFSGISLYHFVEFWAGSLFKTLYPEKSDVVLFFYIYPLFKTFSVLAIFSIFADQIYQRKVLFLVLGILLCFVVLGVRWVSMPLSRSYLRDIILIPILILVARALYLKKYDAALALLMVGVVENILLLPAVFITAGMFYKNIAKSSLLKALVFVIMFALVFFLFQEKIDNKYFQVDQQFTDYFPTMSSIRKTFLLAIITYPLRLVLAFFVFLNYKKFSFEHVRMNLGYWALAMFGVYQGLYALLENLSIDAWQLKYIAEITARISLLFLFFLLIKRKNAVVGLVVLLLVSDYNYPFGKVPLDSTYEISLEQKIERLGKGKPLKGLFIHETMPLEHEYTLFFYPTFATDYARGIDFRMYLFQYDVTGLRQSIPALRSSSHLILQKNIVPLFVMDKSLKDVIESNNISIVWISKESKYLKAFKQLTPLHELKDYYVYYLAPAPEK